MARFFKSLLLPFALLLLCSAQDCESGAGRPHVQVTEEISIDPEGGLEVALAYTADSLDFLLEGDPTPTLEMGWDSVHLGFSGRKEYALKAWKDFHPGQRLPTTFAQPGDPLLDWTVRFSTQLRREERGDTVLYYFQRVYPAMDWIPMELFSDLLEEEDRLEEQKDSLEGLNPPVWEAFEEKWDDDYLPEMEADSVLLVEYVEDLQEVFSVGDPPYGEVLRRLLETELQLRVLDEGVWVLPVARSLTPGGGSDCIATLEELVMASKNRVEVTRGHALQDLFQGGDPLPEFLTGGDPLDKKEEVKRVGSITLGEVREALLTQCGASAQELMEFDRRYRWLSKRYVIREGRIESRSQRVLLSMPGRLLKHNADSISEGRAQWRFGLRDLSKGEVTLSAVSRLIGGRGGQ